MPPWRCLIALSCSSGSRISPSIPRQPHQESSNSVRNFCVWLLLLLLPRCPWLRFSSFILSVLRFRQQIEIEMLPQNRETATATTTAAIATAAATASGNGRSCNALHTHTETHKQAKHKGKREISRLSRQLQLEEHANCRQALWRVAAVGELLPRLTEYLQQALR